MNKPSLPILIIDDDEIALTYYSTILDEKGFNNYILCQDSRKVIKLLDEKSFSVILLDLYMPHYSGEDLLKLIKEKTPEVPVIIITSSESVYTAVECMKLGVHDYMVKPVSHDHLVIGVKNAIKIHELHKEVDTLRSQLSPKALKHPEEFSRIITNSEAMHSVFRYIESIAESPRPVLITGESGAGKELIAEVIHRLSLVEGLFVPVNVAGLPDAVFSDTLFGHKKGAYTGADSNRKGLVEKAAGGTLFLDEIGDLAEGSQIKLLRLLQEEEYYPIGSDVKKKSTTRIITATNVNLKEKQETNKFRKDLFYRLISHHIQLPPLRDRLEDIPFLVDHFIKEACLLLKKKEPAVPGELTALLKTYNFPGNIRELQTIIFDAITLHKSGILSLKYFRDYFDKHRTKKSKMGENPGERISYYGDFPTLKEVEDFFIGEAMKKADNNQTIAAQMLGVSQSTLSRRARK